MLPGQARQGHRSSSRTSPVQLARRSVRGGLMRNTRAGPLRSTLIRPSRPPDTEPSRRRRIRMTGREGVNELTDLKTGSRSVSFVERKAPLPSHLVARSRAFESAQGKSKRVKTGITDTCAPLASITLRFRECNKLPERPGARRPARGSEDLHSEPEGRAWGEGG